MHERSSATTTIPAPGRDVLAEILRAGAQRRLRQAIEAEVGDWTQRHAEFKDERGRQPVVRNGHRPTRTLVTGVGAVEVTQPRVLDRRIVGQNADGQDMDAAGQPVERFNSKLRVPVQLEAPCALNKPHHCRRTCGRPRRSRS